MSHHHQKILFYLYFLTLGLVSSLGQMILLREVLTSFRGNEVFLTYFLVSWLTLVGCGSLVKGDWLKPKYLTILISLYYFIINFLMIGLFLAIRILPQLLHATSEVPNLLYSLISLPLIIAPIALLLGLGFSWGSSYFYNITPKASVGIINLAYLIETFGFFIGSLAFNFWLINFTAAKLILLLITFCLLINILFLIHQTLSKVTKIFAFTLNLVAILLTLISFNWANFYENQTANWRTPQEKLIISHNSSFGNIVVTKKEEQYNFYQNGSLISPAKDFQTAEELIHLPLAFTTEPKEILIIGNAWNGYLKEALKYPNLKIVYAEIDPDFLPTIYDFFSQEQKNDLNNPRIKIIAADAFSYLKNNKENFDLILSNLPAPTTFQINRYYTKEFFSLAKNNLNSQGILAFSLSYHPENLTNANTNRFLNSIYQPLESTFPQNRLIPGQSLIFLSLKNSQATWPVEKVAQNFAQNNLATSFVSAPYIEYLLTNKRSAEILTALKENPAVANTIRQPAAFLYQLINQKELAGISFSKILNWLYTSRWIILSLILIILPLIIHSNKQNSSNLGLPNQYRIIAVIASSLSLIWEIIIIFIWQATFGYIYTVISLIIGLVMLGIFLANLQLYIKPPVKREKTLKYFLGLLVFLTLVILIHLLTINSYPLVINKVILLTAALLAGYLAGAIYPLINFLYLEKIPLPESETGKIYGLELLGGALILGIFSLFILPFFGLKILIIILIYWSGLIFLLPSTARHQELRHRPGIGH